MQASALPSVRRHELDWLRVFSILAVFGYHSLHFFDQADWTIKNPTTYSWVSWVMALGTQWIMPLIFCVSGASTFFATRRARLGRFLGSKVLRLLVPLALGMFTFSTGQVYLERLTHNQFEGTYLQFLPHYFEGIYIPGGTGNFAFFGMHLWYLLLLFLFTLLLLPLFWWFKSSLGARLLQRTGDLLALPGGLLFFVVLTIILQNVTQTGALLGDVVIGAWSLVPYLWFFLSGYIIMSHERLQQRIVQARWVCLALTLVQVVLPLIERTGPTPHPDLAVWPGIFAALGFSMRHLNFRNQFLAYANEAVLPFYVLHQDVLLWVGYVVVRWQVPDLAKYLMITLTAFLLILGLYEYGVRRVNALRVLFGLKPLPRPASPRRLMRARSATR